jgi:hypothetical protein
MSPLESALDQLRIPELWRILGLPGEPPERDKTVRSPFRVDRHPSFSIFDNGRRWKDHGTGERGSDAAGFLAKARGISNEEACRELIRLAGTSVHAESGRNSSSYQASAAPPRAERKRVIAELPRPLKWDRDTAQRVANSRGLRITAIEFSFIWLKTLTFMWWCNHECWVLGDRSRRCVEARRIDREMFPATKTLEERKAHTFSGYSDKSWPVGILPSGFEEPWLTEHVHKIMLVEGGPDYLAACQLIAESPETDFDNVLPAAIFGAGNDIAIDALTHFSARQITIVAHGEDAGQDAAARWAEQIKSAGGSAQVLYLNQGTDLCDAVAAGATYDDIRLF